MYFIYRCGLLNNCDRIGVESNGGKMEYRKLISFGKSSFVVSLPKPWIDKHKLQKGDIIHLDENEDNLVMMPKQLEQQKEEKEIVINVDGKNIKHIQRELIPAYVNNYKTVILAGKEIKDKAKKIEPLIQDLIALEIMEQDSKRIIAKDFLNMQDISIQDLIRKMDIITRTMIKDCGSVFKEDTYENINHRDKDVNRLSYLIFRAVNYGLENQTYMIKQFKLKPQDLLRYHLLAFHIEVIADEARRIARYMDRIKLNREQQKVFLSLLNQIYHTYNDTLKAFYLDDSELAHTIAIRKPLLIEEGEKFLEANKKKEWIGDLIGRTKRLIVTVHKTGRLAYQ